MYIITKISATKETLISKSFGAEDVVAPVSIEISLVVALEGIILLVLV